MEIPAWLFISFWAVVSFTSLHMGFHTLGKTKLYNSLPPLVTFFFQHYLAVSSCFSSIYSLKLRAQSDRNFRNNFALLVYLVFPNTIPQKIHGMFTSAWDFLKSEYIHFKLTSSFRKILSFLHLVFVGIIQYLVYLLICSIGFSAFGVVVFICFACFGTVGYVVFSLLLTRTVDWASLFIFLPTLFLLMYPYILLVLGLICILIILGAINNRHFRELKTRAAILLALEIYLFFINAKSNFSPLLVLCISNLIGVWWASFSRFGDRTLYFGVPLSNGESAVLVHRATRFVALKMKEVLSKLLESKAKKFIEFGVGTLGALLFQNFFRVTSFDEVVAFLCFAVTCLANQVLLSFCGDLGVFKFLLTNAVVGCTVGHFGLHHATWLAFAIVLLLFALHLILESVAMAYNEDEHIRFRSMILRPISFSTA